MCSNKRASGTGGARRPSRRAFGAHLRTAGQELHFRTQIGRRQASAAGEHGGAICCARIGGSLDRYGFCQVAGLVYVASAAYRYVIGQKLQRNDFE